MLIFKNYVKNFNISFLSHFKGRSHKIVFFFFCLALLPVLFCFREDVLKKVEVYNAIDLSGEAPFYIEVVSVYPAIGGVNVPVNTDIDVAFNDNIDMSTVDPSTFIVDGGAVAGVFTYDSQQKTVKFNPGSDLLPSTSYMVNLTTGIKNPVGETMVSDFSWSFTTAARGC